MWSLLELSYYSECNVVFCCGILLSEPFPIYKSVHIWCVVTTDNLSANSFSINCQLTFLFSFFFFPSLQQRGCWKNWSIHNPEHCVRKNEIWRCCRYLPDCQNVKDAAASHGTDRGEQNSICVQWWWKRRGISTAKKCTDRDYIKCAYNCILIHIVTIWLRCKLCHKGTARTIPCYSSRYYRLGRKKFISVVDPKLW